jgi:hypothetical protein
MKKKVLIEGALFLIVSIVSMVEGLRLITEKDPTKVPELFGPGAYVFSLGVALCTVGVIHLIVHIREVSALMKGDTDIEMRKKAIRLSAALFLYLVLICIVGYPVATPIFFSIAFWIVGIRSWHFNVILALILSGAFYFVFVVYCNMIFPRGLLFGI